MSDSNTTDNEALTRAAHTDPRGRVAENGVLMDALRQGEHDLESGRLHSHESMRAKWFAMDDPARLS